MFYREIRQGLTMCVVFHCQMRLNCGKFSPTDCQCTNSCPSFLHLKDAFPFHVQINLPGHKLGQKGINSRFNEASLG